MIILGVSSVQQNCFEFVLVFLIARNDYVECLKFFSRMVLKCSLFYLIPRNDYVGCLKFCILRCSQIFKLTKLPKLHLFVNMLIITQLAFLLSSPGSQQKHRSPLSVHGSHCSVQLLSKYRSGVWVLFLSGKVLDLGQS